MYVKNVIFCAEKEFSYVHIITWILYDILNY